MNNYGIQRQTPRERALRELKTALARGEWRPGEYLPTEQALAERFEVSRPTLRRAIEDLIEMGQIIRQRGGKREVAPRTRSLLADTILVLTDGSFATGLPGMREAGWEVHLNMGALAGLNQQRYSSLLVHTSTGQDALDHLCEGGPAGILALHNVGRDARLQRLIGHCQEYGIPVAAHATAQDLPQVDTVESDHAAGAAAIVQWLLGQGCGRLLRINLIGHDTPAQAKWLAERDRGHVEALRRAGHQALPPIVMRMERDTSMGQSVFEATAQRLAGLLADRLQATDALVAITDGAVPVIARALRLLNQDPKGRLITGYDRFWNDIPERRLEPIAPCVSVDKRNFHIGCTLVDVLTERIRNPGRKEVQHLLIEPTLVIQGEILAERPS